MSFLLRFSLSLNISSLSLQLHVYKNMWNKHDSLLSNILYPLLINKHVSENYFSSIMYALTCSFNMNMHCRFINGHGWTSSNSMPIHWKDSMTAFLKVLGKEINSTKTPPLLDFSGEAFSLMKLKQKTISKWRFRQQNGFLKLETVRTVRGVFPRWFS